MTYRGKVKDGVVVLEPGATLPDGAEVRVEAIVPPATEQPKTLGLKQACSSRELAASA